MSKLIVTGPDLRDQKINISWNFDDLHPTLQEDLSINRHIAQDYVKKVVEAVQASLNDPDTKPAILTDSVVKERVDLAHKLLMIMREEAGFALRRAINELQGRLLEQLKTAHSAEDVVQPLTGRAVWGTGKTFTGERDIVGEVDDPKELNDGTSEIDE